MCGISGIISADDNIVPLLYDSLFNIQHRGQEASGLHVCFSDSSEVFKSNLFGLLDKQIPGLSSVSGTMGIGHLRYPTSGNKTVREIQPFSIIYPYHVSLVHNGNITNQQEILDFLKEKGIALETTSDSELILKLFYFFMEVNFNKITNQSIFSAVHKIFDICRGSFSVIIMIKDYGLVVFRDRHGIRPLSYNNDTMFIVSSETVGLSGDSYENVLNGEIIIVNKQMEIEKCLKNHNISYLTPCLFEYIYIARLESFLNDVLVYEFREKIGEKMADMISPEIVDEIDFVVPIPLTSVVSANSLAYVIKKPIKYPVMKNRYTHRTFINSGDEIVKNIKKIKVNNKIIRGKTILVVDDSIVRGNTSKHIIQGLRDAGVDKIYFACCSPPIRFPNIYGIAIPTAEELIAHEKSTEEIASFLNIDKLYYLPLETMCSVLKELNPALRDFEKSVFTGTHIQ